MARRLGTRFLFQDCSLHLFSVGSAYTLKLWISGKEAEYDEFDDTHGFRVWFGCNVSILGPYYLVRHRGLPEEEPYAQEVTREIEATYGYEAVPPELGNIVVPEVALDTVSLGEVTIYQCLLGTHWGE